MLAFRNAIAVSALALLASSTLTAQGGISRLDGVVGWVPVGTGTIHAYVGCSDLRTCNGNLPAPPTDHSGGTAYDARHQAAWVSNGGKVELRSLIACQRLCEFTHFPVTLNGTVTGLAMHEHTQTLWVLDAAAGRYGLSSYDVSGVPSRCATRKTTCRVTNLGIPFGMAAGLALDDASGLLYVVIHEEPTFGGPRNHITVASTASPCNLICKQLLPRFSECTFGLAQGLAYNPAKGELDLTDGTKRMTLSVTQARSCKFSYVRCCTLKSSPRGLATVPGWVLKRTTFGGCYTAPCQVCDGIGAVTYGDPVIGNPSFRIDLVRAPAQQLAVFFLKVGPLGPPLDVFCGKFFVLPELLSLASTTTGSGCDGSMQVPLPLPADPKLRGARLSAQFFLACPTATGTGYGLSNGIEFAIQ